ncbi:MAG: hypothetical protein LZF62_430194 [Nitrospira sp.]|nr:MAG: hypothetical protein LZF62_430194 [Nitrospira sp.]
MAAPHFYPVTHRFPQVLELCTLLQDLPPRGEWDGLPLHPGPSGGADLGIELEKARRDELEPMKRAKEIDHHG